MATSDTAPRESRRRESEGAEKGGGVHQAGDGDGTVGATHHTTGDDDGANKARRQRARD